MSIRKLGIGGSALVVWVVLLGVVALPALAVAPEAPVTKPVSELTATSVKFNGELNPKASATAGYYFEYNAGPGCVAGRATGQQPEVTGKAVLVSALEAGLSPNSEYTVCVVATRLEGGVSEVTFGQTVTFHTLAAKPSIDAESAPVVKSTEVVLEGQVNPNNQDTHAYLQYSASAAVVASGPEKGALKTPTKTATPPGADLGEGFGDQPVSSGPVTGLVAGVEYYYQAVAVNATGTSYGPVQELVTVPVPHTDPATLVGATSVTLNGHFVLDEAAGTQYYFEYNLGGACGGGPNTAPPTEAGKGPGTATASTAVAGLQPSALYSVCLVTRDEFGTPVVAVGAEVDPTSPPVQFTTLPEPPEVTGESSSEVEATSAVIHATVNPNNQSTTYAVEYAESAAGLGTPAAKFAGPPAGTAPLTGYGPQGIAFTAEGFDPRTEYFYRVVATNASHEVGYDGETLSFLTLSRPLVTTGEAKEVTRSTAVLSGTINPGGVPTRYHFVYVPATGYTPGAEECASEPVQLCAYGAGAKSTEGAESAADYKAHAAGPVTVEELAAGTTYDYALVAEDSQGTTVGPNESFTTAAPALPPGKETQSTPAVGAVQATLPFVPYTPISQIAAQQEKEEKGTTSTGTKALTNAQKLSKALKSCKKDKSKSKRAACERSARKKYAAKKKKKGGKR